MPDAPAIEPTEVTAAIATLNERSEGHSDLVARWGSSFGEQLAYAKSAFRDIATNRPDMIQKFEAAGLGDDVSVIEHLAQFGRQQAGRLGDFTIARNSQPSEPAAFNRAGPPTARGTSFGANRGSEETQNELNELYAANPPGSPSYKNVHVQSRIQQLTRILAGSGSAIGTNGRTS